MSLADRIPSEDRSLDAGGVSFVLSFSAFAFVGFLLLLYTLQRLGIDGDVSTSLAAAWIAASILILSWLGQSVSGSRFFFAAHKAEAISTGIGGASCWAGGAVVATFFALPTGDGYRLLVALMLGLALQTFLLARPINTGSRSTLPGLLARRYDSRIVGLVCLIVCLFVLGAVSVAEFEIAILAFSSLTQLSPQVVIWIVLGLAILPIMFGGWQALLLVNACVGIWILLCMLTPALIAGFFPAILEGKAQSGALDPIVLPTAGEVFSSATPFGSLNILLVMAFGFAILPQTMARSALAKSRIAAAEGLGWTGLVIFLLLSTLFLSIGLVIQSGTETQLGKLLKSSVTISVLPHLALFLLAFNALSVTLFVAATSIVRAIRAHGDREPGVGSMFAVRLMVLILAAALIYGRDYITFGVPELLISALAISAAGLFPVLVTSFWFTGSSQLFAAIAMVAGTACACSAFFISLYDIPTSGTLGAGCSMALALTGHLWTKMHRKA